MNQQYLRTQYVDIISSEMPNYSVYQRNLEKIPAGVIYQQESQQIREPIVIDNYDININEKYNQFSQQAHLSSNIPEKSYGPVFIADRSNQIPNFDIEYKGTRSLFSSKYRKPLDPMKEQLMELKNQPFMQLRNSYAQVSSIKIRSSSFSQSDYIQSPFSSAKNSQVFSRDPDMYNRQPLGESNYSAKSRFLSIYDNKPAQQENQNYNRNFDMAKMKSGLIDERPFNESKIVFQEENGVQNYSRYLLNSGDRRIFTQGEKSHYASKALYSKPTENVREFNVNDGQERYSHQQQTPNFQASMYSRSSIDRPEVFLRQNVLY